MGWLLVILALSGTVAVLRLLGVRGGSLQACAAALLFGAVGYAVQGRADLPASPARGAEARQILPLTDARHAFFGKFTHAETWLRMSEGLARSGSSEDSVNILQNAVRRYPNEPQLWIGLGNALVDHGQGLTPAAELAYRRAMELSPGYPAPPFFLGLARARSGDREGAIALWKQVLADGPANASWRPLVEGGITALSRPAPR